METTIPLNELVAEAKAAFLKEFGSGEASIVGASAPGRVNIIGEHTDYNDGFVLPMAIPLWTVVIGRRNGKEAISLVTLSKDADQPRKVEFEIPSTAKPLEPSSNPKWANYVKGVIQHFPGNLPGFDAIILTTVPLGGGLSSSASLEVATCTFLEALTKTTLTSNEKALLCQKAEHTFAGMPCGIMDQFICCMGQVDSALLIDCRSLHTQLIPLRSSEAQKSYAVPFLVVNSNVKHELTGGEYAQRRDDCMAAAKILGIKSLRDATLCDLRKKREELGDRIYQRALHVVTEIERCEKAAEALKDGDLISVGRLMYQSHVSLRDLYQVSCPELDQLVDITMQTKGVLGARMTGGGFGGCIVALLDTPDAKNIVDVINQKYKKKATSYIFQAVSGTAEINFN